MCGCRVPLEGKEREPGAIQGTADSLQERSNSSDNVRHFCQRALQVFLLEQDKLLGLHRCIHLKFPHWGRYRLNQVKRSIVGVLLETVHLRTVASISQILGAQQQAGPRGTDKGSV
jgi:hypothetical protein